MSDDFILSSTHYKELLQSLKDSEAYGKASDANFAKLQKAARPVVTVLEDYLKTKTHPGVSRLLTDLKDAL